MIRPYNDQQKTQDCDIIIRLTKRADWPMEDKARADCSDRIDIPLKVETKIERKQQNTTTLCKALLTAEDKRVEKETKRGSFTKVETKTIISRDRDLKTSITQA